MIGNWSRVFDPGLGYYYSHQPTGMVIGAYLVMIVLTILALACSYLPPLARWLMIPVGLLMFDDSRRGLSIPVMIAVPILIGALLVVAKLIRDKRTTWLKVGTTTFELLGVAGIAMCLGALTLLRPTIVPPAQPKALQKPGPRIVLAVFDELDPVHVIEKWPKEMPENEFIKLSRESLYFENCLQPGKETLYSLPAMTIGHTVELAKPAGNNTLNLIAGGKKREWAEKPNVLLEARDSIGASAMGWYHPYDREFPGVDGKFYERVSDNPIFCFWLMVDFLVERPFQMVGKNSQTKMLNTFYSIRQREMIEDFHRTVPDFIKQHYGFILLHVPCPHGPYVMRPVEGDPLGFDPQSYYGATAYAGEIYRTIEKTLKESKVPYTLIATSDHNLRIPLNGINPCGRVPMMISGTNIKVTQKVTTQAYGELVADVVRTLIANPNAPSDVIIRALTKPHP